jgi:predicted  nucleic acid-binding Zn-ribbon protein
MSAPTLSPCLDIDETVPIVVEWECDGATHYLAKPDPKIDNITLKTRLSESALFELRFPVNLKGIEGVTSIAMSIDPSSITSFEFASATTVPDEVKEKFNSRMNRLVFRISKSAQILVPISAKEPLAPARAQSGKVIDAIRTLSAARAFIVYIDDKKLSNDQLQSIHDAVNRGGLTPLRDRNDLASMYHGTGAKLVDLVPQIHDAPPSYNETEPPPPPPPINEKKRRRVDSEGKDSDAISEIWAELKARDERDRAVQNELSDLKQENKSLREELEQIRQQVATFHQNIDTLKLDVEHLQGQDKHNADTLEGYDTRLVELRDDLEDLDAKVDSIQEHRDENGVARDFLDKVRSDVYDDIITRLTG